MILNCTSGNATILEIFVYFRDEAISCFKHTLKSNIVAILVMSSVIYISKVLEFYKDSFEPKFVEIGYKKCFDIFMTSGAEFRS